MPASYPPNILMEEWDPDRPLPRAPLGWPTWEDYRQFLRERNDGGIPFPMWWMEMGVVNHLARALGVDDATLDALLENPDRFGPLGIMCQHPAGGGMFTLTSLAQYEEMEADVEACGGPEGWRREDFRRMFGHYPGEGPKRERKRRKPEEGRSDKFRYWLYHIYGEGDRLLYIGITRNREGREAAHRSRWGSLIERFEYQEFRSAEAVMAEEKRLIAEHNPPFNAEHVGALP